MLGGSFTSAGLGTIQRVGAGTAVQLTGMLDNVGRTLFLNDAIGQIDLWNGTIAGGRIEGSGGGRLGTASPSSDNRPTLDGVTLAAPLDVGPGAFVTVKNGMTLDGGSVSVRDGGGNSGALLFDVGAPATLGGTGEVVFNGVTGPSVNGFTQSGPGTFTIGAGVTIRAGRAVATSCAEFGLVSTVNHGNILSDVAAKRVNGYRVTNDGQIRASGGGQVWLWGLKNQSGGVVSASNGGSLLLRDGFENSGTVARWTRP